MTRLLSNYEEEIASFLGIKSESMGRGGGGGEGGSINGDFSEIRKNAGKKLWKLEEERKEGRKKKKEEKSDGSSAT